MTIFDETINANPTERLISAYRESERLGAELRDKAKAFDAARDELNCARACWPKVEDGRKVPARFAVDHWSGKYLVSGYYSENIYVVDIDPLLDVVDVKL